MWKGKTRGGTFGYLFFIFLIRYLGITAAYIFLCFVVPYFIPFAPKATASTWYYARNILKYGRLRSIGLLFRNYYRLGQILIDKVAINSGMDKKYHFKFGNYQEFLDILNSEQGVIMIGAHMGNWETGAPFFHDYGKKINIVIYDAEHRKIKEMLEKNGMTKEYKFIPVNKDSLEHVFRINEVLNKKEYVCFQGDRYLNSDRLLTCDFMGKPAHFPSGPFLLASRMKVPVVFYFAMREPKRTYHFHFISEVSASGSSSEVPGKVPVPGFHAGGNEVKDSDSSKTGAKKKRPEQALLEDYVKALENMVKQYPEQWFNYYPFWGPEAGKPGSADK